MLRIIDICKWERGVFMKKQYIVVFVVLIMLIIGCVQKRTEVTTPELPTPTVTPDANGISCFNYILKDFDESHIRGYYHNWFGINGDTISVRGYTYYGNINVKLAIYDGGGTKLNWNDSIIISDAQGYFARDYITQNIGNTLNPWHAVILDSSSSIPDSYIASNSDFIDSQEIYVATASTTPVIIPPCVNMPILFGDAQYQIEKYNFKFNDCSALFYANRWCSETLKVAYYDGSNNLIYVDEQPCDAITPLGVEANTSKYILAGTEAAGIWHIIAYNISVTPPSTFTTCGGGVNNCPSCIEFVVE